MYINIIDCVEICKYLENIEKEVYLKVPLALSNATRSQEEVYSIFMVTLAKKENKKTCL